MNDYHSLDTPFLGAEPVLRPPTQCYPKIPIGERAPRCNSNSLKVTSVSRR